MQRRDVFAADEHLAGIGTLQEVDAPHQCGFARAGKPDDAVDFSFFDFQAHVIRRENLSVIGFKSLCDANQFYHMY